MQGYVSISKGGARSRLQEVEAMAAETSAVGKVALLHVFALFVSESRMRLSGWST